MVSRCTDKFVEFPFHFITLLVYFGDICQLFSYSLLGSQKITISNAGVSFPVFYHKSNADGKTVSNMLRYKIN